MFVLWRHGTKCGGMRTFHIVPYTMYHVPTGSYYAGFYIDVASLSHNTLCGRPLCCWSIPSKFVTHTSSRTNSLFYTGWLTSCKITISKGRGRGYSVPRCAGSLSGRHVQKEDRQGKAGGGTTSPPISSAELWRTAGHRR